MYRLWSRVSENWVHLGHGLERRPHEHEDLELDSREVREVAFCGLRPGSGPGAVVLFGVGVLVVGVASRKKPAPRF